MQRSIFRNTLCALLLAVFAAGFTACVYDDLPDTEGGGIEMPDTEGFSLGLTISLDNNLSRAGEDDYENYIDTKHRFRVLFFTERGQFIFEAIDRTVMRREVLGDDGATKIEWFVHIPVNYVVDHAGSAYDIETLKTQLKEQKFKVAVLANWPLVNENGKPTDDLRTVQPNWGYNESIYGRNTKNINDLHHLVYDSNYSETDTNNNTRPSKQESYGFIMNNGKMGVQSDWVKSRMPESRGVIDSKEDAEAWIKQNWNPYPADAQRYRHYTYMWYVWNFAAVYNRNANYFSSDNIWGSQWLQRYNVLSNFYLWLLRNIASTLNDPTDDANLYFTNTYTWPDSNNNPVTYDLGATLVRPLSDRSNYAVRLPNIGPSIGKAVNNGTLTADDYKYPYGIRFTATSTGTLRIKAASPDGVSTRLAVYDPAGKSSSSVGGNAFDSRTPIYVSRDISVTGDPKEYYIYCDRGNAVDIYEIEYVNAKYLYDTDREGVMPSEDQPIPMYGLQDYDALGDWEPGTTFDLSHARNGNTDYDYKSIYLIRSVAKVELYFAGNKPDHVYLRSMNRTARCEPMDVQTPTDQTWNSSHASSGNNRCEWFDIQAYGCGYTGSPGQSESNTRTEIGAYQQWLSWFYRSWASARWLNGGQNGWSFSGIGNPNTSLPSPQVFNPDINRSDYCHFIDQGDENGYHKYVLYVPEKNIDDPNYPGITSSIPKVAHVEYRYASNTNTNLDDNLCFRIYFTDNSSDALQNTHYTQFESDYEKTPDNLNNHWPIMRNHVYRFYVNGQGTRAGGAASVVSEVTTWNGEPVGPNAE